MVQNLKILVVDDYNTMVRIVRKLLKQIGYEDVDEASNGEMAFGMISEEPVWADHFRLEYGAHDRLRVAATG